MFSAKSIRETIAALLVFLFLYTGLSKYLDYQNFNTVLHRTPLINHYAGFVSVVLPAVELVVTILLIIPASRLIGLYCSLILLSMFTVYLIYMVSSRVDLPCTCGGVISQMSWKQHIIFNVVFVILSAIGIRFQKRIGTEYKSGPHSDNPLISNH